MDEVRVPFIPRLVLEARKNQGTCVLSGVTEYTTGGLLDVDGLCKHVNDALSSSRFIGYVMVILLECEDRCFRLDIFPHILAERCIVYWKNDTVAMEMCALISVVENLAHPTTETLRSILDRAEKIQLGRTCDDLRFLFHGLKKLIFTLIEYLGIDWPYDVDMQGMQVYRLYKELSRFPQSEACEILLTAMITSKKLDFITSDIRVDSCEDAKIMYVSTMFTKPLEFGIIRTILLDVCGQNVTLDKILYKL